MTAGEMQLDARKTWDKAASRRVRTRLNVPLITGTLVAVVVLGVLGWWRYTAQSTALADAFLADAERSRESGDFDRAARLLHDYLLLRPDDVSGRTCLADVYDRTASDDNGLARSIEYHRRAIGMNEPGSATEIRLRRRLAELLLSANRFQEAEAEADSLLARRSLNGSAAELEGDAAEIDSLDETTRVALRVKAIATCGQARPADLASTPDAWIHLEAALEALPGDVELAELAVAFVQALPRHASLSAAEREARINGILDRLVQAAPNNAQAYLVRYRYSVARSEADPGEGSPYDPASDLDKALSLAPDDYNVQMTAGQAALHRADQARAAGDTERVNVLAEKAREHFQKASELEPRRELAHLALGQVALVQGNASEAVRLWQAGIDQLPAPSVELHLRIAEAALSAGDDARAEAALDAAARMATELFTVQSSSAAKLLTATLQNRVALLRARLLLSRKDHASAVTLLRQLAVSVADGLEGSSDTITQRELSQVHYLLGLAHSRMRNWDLAAQAFQRSLEAGLQSRYAVLACALAWKKAGNMPAAAEYYSRLLGENDAPPAAILELAELRLQEQLQRPAAQRRWTHFDRLLEKLEDRGADRWEVKLLRARRALATGGHEAAEQPAKLLAEAERLAPKDANLWQKLVLLYDAAGEPENADAALLRFKELESSEQRQLALEIELLTSRGQYDGAAGLLEQQLGSADPRTEAVVLNRLWLVELQRGNRREARRHLLTLHERAPTDLAPLEHLANLDLQHGDYEQVASWEDRLLDLEGEDGTSWRYFRALRKIAESNGPSDPAFLEAKRLAQAIAARRPSWGSGVALMGRIHAIEGATDRAIQSFENAIEHGDRSLATYEQLLRALYQAGRVNEAENYVAHLDTAVSASSRLAHISISLAANQQKWHEAQTRAEEAIRLRPSDPLTHIWLGHVLAAQDRLPEAEAAYRKAVAADASSPWAWQALASFYHRSDRPHEARETLKELRDRADMPPVQKDLLIARHFSRLGDTQRALEILQEAEQREPARAEIKRGLASLLLAVDPDLAEVKLREALKLEPESDETRRMLAALLASRGGGERWSESLSLVRRPAENTSRDADDRLQAAMLVRRGGQANRTQAMQLLERLVRQPAPHTQDLLLLAQLYEAEGRIAAARAQFEALVLRARPEPAHLILATEFYLRCDLASEARELLKQLAARAADCSWEEQQRCAALQAKYHMLVDDEEAAQAVLERWADADATEDSRPGARHKAAASILLDLGQYSAAEQWLRRLVEMDAATYPLLARSLALQSRHGEALGLCLERTGGSVSSTTVSAVAALLSCGSPSPEDFEIARPLLERAEKHLRDDPQARFALGLIAVLEEKNEEAISHFEVVRRLRPSDVRALNNLATLYGEQPDGLGRALECIQEAIDAAGPQPVLLDTQGVLQLQQGKVDEAIASLEQSVAVPVPDPRYLFHLAAAYERAGKTARASDVYRRATEGGLENELLTKGDKKLLADLGRQIAR